MEFFYNFKELLKDAGTRKSNNILWCQLIPGELKSPPKTNLADMGVSDFTDSIL